MQRVQDSLEVKLGLKKEEDVKVEDTGEGEGNIDENHENAVENDDDEEEIPSYGN